MKLAYLLPCTCGQKIEVDSTKAGLTVTCTCGKTLDVPTMRHLGDLERVGSAPRAATSWGPRQGYTLLGALVLLLGLGWLGYQVVNMPGGIYVVPQEIREEVSQYPPADLAQQYKILRMGLDPREPEVVKVSRAYEAWHRRWTYVAAGVSLLGGLLTAGAWFGMAESKRPPGKPRR
ncbi:MAG: hypothetical protein KF708_23710 [Pirellulales bacterium]|nr:hypothetical protein [Pirellulales bacterium]